MNIPKQFPEIGVLFANNGFVTILKKMTVSRVAVVVGNRVSREESPHEFGEPRGTAAKKDMGMIRHQRPCINGGPGFRGHVAHAGDKVPAVVVINGDFSLLYPPENDMV